MKIKNTIIYISLFLLAFLPRIIQPVSAPIQWYWRPLQFYRSLLQGDFEKTFQSGHPGVTVMWISGLPEYLYRRLTGFPANLDPWDQLPGYYIPQSAIFTGWAPLVVLISLGVCLTYFLLKKLFAPGLALVAAIFVALDPYFLYQSKVLHIDATLTSLMMLSTLAFLVYLKINRRRYLIISAILGGLAILTKTPAVFLIPFVGLSLLVTNFSQLKESLTSRSKIWAASVKIFKPLAIWIAIALFLFFTLFPALWVSPRVTLQKYLNLGVKVPAFTPHEFQNYFLGETQVLKQLGFKFYFLTVLFFTTPLTIISSAISVTYLLRRRLQKEGRKTIFLILCYCFFFLIMVSLTAKKGNRYLTPLFPMLSILGAFGFYQFLKELIPAHAKNKILIAAVSFLLLLNFGPVLLKHPYYGTYFNPLFGGHKIADFVFSIGDQSEGVKEAFDHMNQKENIENLRIACDMPIYACTQNTKAKIFSINEENVDYLVFFRNKVVRESNKRVWDKYKNREPEKVVSFDGIPYVWVYKAI